MTDQQTTPKPRFTLISDDDVLKMIGDADAEIHELAGAMYKKLSQGVEPVELVTLEFDLGRTKAIANRRAAALDYIAELIEDLHRLTFPTPAEIRITLQNVYTVQRFA